MLVHKDVYSILYCWLISNFNILYTNVTGIIVKGFIHCFLYNISILSCGFKKSYNFKISFCVCMWRSFFQCFLLVSLRFLQCTVFGQCQNLHKMTSTESAVSFLAVFFIVYLNATPRFLPPRVSMNQFVFFLSAGYYGRIPINALWRPSQLCPVKGCNTYISHKYRRHWQEKHETVVPCYKCLTCHQFYSRQSSVIRHVKQKHGGDVASQLADVEYIHNDRFVDPSPLTLSSILGFM